MKQSVSLLFCLTYVLLQVTFCQAQDDFERPPIEYSQAEADNPISRLQSQLDNGTSSLQYDEDFGYLRSLLSALQVPVESQMLVFSRTSLQASRIRPRTPRALYFNDDVYVGYCVSGDVLEISVADPNLGAVFYTLDQTADSPPVLLRQTDNCLVCHASSRTENVPGHLVRSLFVDASGQPVFSLGSHSVTHSTPLENRWGGWYVTGTHGEQTHLGNLVVTTKIAPHLTPNDQGQNVTSLADRFDVDQYLTPHSDIIALMLLEHQALVHNRITKAHFATLQAHHYQQTINESLGEPAENRFDSTTRRIHTAGDDLIEALLLAEEAPLTGSIRGTSGYAEKFTAQGPFDKKNRSLRELDMNRRMFKYPCSYLIYSEAFNKLPAEVRDYVWQQLWDILTSQTPPEKFAHLSQADRTAIREILQATIPDLPDYWQSTPATIVPAEK